MCECGAIVPVVFASKVVAAEPSPQATVTCHGLSLPGSLNEPRLKEWLSPSFEDWLAGAVTVGGTLATSTTCTDSESVVEAPSESVTLIVTFVVAGPLGKKQSKLPPLGVCVTLARTSWPPEPHCG